MKLSVAICTRNPHGGRLERVLQALSRQSLPAADWELLLVDSASTPPLSSAIASKFGLPCRVVRVDVSGILRARFAAITAARAPLLLFLDDDNVPAPEYLKNGVEIAALWPMLGCWGPALISPECEEAPPPEIVRHLSRMACCDHPEDRWSNTLDVVPPGAGLFLRTAAARAYVAFAADDPRRGFVGETAGRFFRGDDTDLVFHLVKSGAGAGQFRALRLIHLMPASRLSAEYVARLAKAAAGSALVVNHLWGHTAQRESMLDRLVYLLKSARFRGLDRRVARAHRAGEAEGRALLASLKP